VSALGDLAGFLTTTDNWWGRRGIAERTWAHLKLSVFCTAAAVALACPVAVVLGHRRRGGFVAVSIVNIGRAVPSFAIIALVLPFALRWGLGLGFWPTAVALVLLAVPPVFTNAYTGVAGVEPSIVESARGMGMRGREVLWRVELPVALPLVITGIRIAAVQVVATATLGALVGYNCLGSFIIEGKARLATGQGRLLAGAALVAALALATELAFGVAERRLTPWTRRHARPGVDPSADVLAAAPPGAHKTPTTGETP
jgi:osmoprotectant transport system permease protein